MNDKTIKELAVELTVETVKICDGIHGRSVFINQLLRSCSSIEQIALKRNMRKVMRILYTNMRLH